MKRTKPPKLPDSPVPPDLDLRDFRWMKLDLIALFNSEFNATTDDAAWRAGVTLWGKAWHQVPAASLPDDDALLCGLAGLGRDLRTWKRIKTVALHGFTKCYDGRLHHDFLSKMALEAAAERERYVKIKAAERERKSRWRAGGIPPPVPPPVPSPSPSPSRGIPAENAIEGQGEGQGAKEEDSEARASGADAPADPVKAIWDHGLAILGNGQRALLGKLRKTYGDPVLLAAIVSCESECPSEPVAFLVACCERSKANGKGSAEHDRAVDILGRAGFEFDERQGRIGPAKAPH